MTTVLLVRHGRTDWNDEGRVQGWAPTRLSDDGREQATDLGTRLADRTVDRLVTSDLRRARETARLLAESGVDGEPSVRKEWRERDFGVYQGMTREAVYRRRPRARSLNSLTALEEVDNGESLADFRERVRAAFDRVSAETDDDETALVVTHGGPIRLLRGDALGLDDAETFGPPSPPNCSVLELVVEDGRATVASDPIEE